MTVVLVIGLLGGGLWLAGGVARRWLSRRRMLRQLLRAEAEVAAAVADGRLEGTSGEALLQHLEGLRRDAEASREW